jgi:uncharacterized protein YqgC (DUF456 family)
MMKSISILGLVLLLAVSARPAGAQDTHVPASLPALPVSLMPTAGMAPSGSIVVERRRNRVLGVGFGAVFGAVAGAMVANYAVCTYDGGEGNAQGICKAAGTGLGAIVGAVVGGIIGFPMGRDSAGR